MAQTRLSPKEFVQECFPARLAVLWTEDADEVCQKNHLNFVQLIQPFCRPSAELIASDLTNHRFYLKNFYLHVTTIEQALPPSPAAARNTFQDHVTKAVEGFDEKNSACLEIATKDGMLRIPSQTPWFEVFRDDYIRTFPFCDYECNRDFLGCIFIVSTSVPDPVARAKLLIEQQVQQQANQKYPRWFGPNILKYFIVLDDLSASSEDTRVRGESALHYFSSTYGEAFCCLLKINSRLPQRPDELPYANPWSGFLKSDLTGEGLENGDEGKEDGEEPRAEHPLAGSGKVEAVEVGLLISPEDVERIREFIVALISRCLIPYAERQIKILNELIISKKGIHRTLVNATKKIFGPSGPPKMTPKVNSGSGSNLSQVVYVGEAVELQNRKAGDLSFIFQLYDQAFQFYQSARRDYSNDQAWNYYAAASEMCGLAAFLSPTAGFSSVNAKGFPLQFFDAAIKSYSDAGKMPHQSIRATLFATEVCKALHLYAEAATILKNRSVDDFDLLFGLCLEQAGHCYLRLGQCPSPRRFALQMIFAGFRYFKAGQRKLGIVAYRQALEVLDGRGWMVAEDHIRLHVVRHSMILRMFNEALSHFQVLFSGAPRQVAAQQFQMFRDFVTCHRIVHGESLQELSMPLITAQKIRTFIGRINDVRAHTVNVVDEEWADLEEKTVSIKGHSQPVFKHQQCVFNDHTDNRHHPVASTGETITVEIPVKNPLNIPLILTNVQLMYDFEPRDPTLTETPVQVVADPAELPLAPGDTSRLVFTLEAQHPGSLKITGLTYTLCTKPESTTTDGPEELLRIRGLQRLTIQGWRLNSNKTEKTSIVHASDRRLEITIISSRGKLVANWENFPKCVLAGQVVRLGLMIENQGRRAVDHAAITASLPEVLVFFNCPKEGNVVTLQIPNGVIEPGKRVALSAIFIAPPCQGSYCLKTLIYYESVPNAEDRDKTHKYRVSRIQQEFDVLPGVTMRGASQMIGGSRNEVVATLQISHVNELQLQSVPVTLVEILSLSHQWKIRNLSYPFSDEGVVRSSEEAFVTLHGKREHSAQLSGFTVSTALDSSDQNFIKAARQLQSSVEGAAGLSLRLLWKVTLTSDGKPTSVFGLRTINFPGPSDTVPDICEILNKVSYDPFIAIGPQLEPALEEPLHVDVVDWSVDLPSEEPELGPENLCVVPLTLRLACTSVIPGDLDARFHVSVEFRTAVKSFPLGNRRQVLLMSPGQIVNLQFDYCFIASGTYNMAEFVSVKAVCDVIPELKVPKLQKPSSNQMLMRIA